MTTLSNIRIPLAVYIVTLVAAMLATAASDAVAIAVAGASVVGAALVWVQVAWVRRERAKGGIESHVASESASLAFYTVITGLATYSLFEAMADAPRPSVSTVLALAGLVWGAWWFAVKRRVA